MNCDDYLILMETGGPLRRLRARLHASRCPRCSALANQFHSAMSRFAQVPALTEEDRRVWERASQTMPTTDRAHGHPPTLDRLRWALFTGVGIAAAACVLIAVLLIVHRPSRQIVQANPVPPPTVRTEDVNATAEYARLSNAVSELDREMLELQRRAQADEARRQIALVLNRFDVH